MDNPVPKKTNLHLRVTNELREGLEIWAAHNRWTLSTAAYILLDANLLLLMKDHPHVFKGKMKLKSPQTRTGHRVKV